MKANLKPPYFGYRGAYKGRETAAEKRNCFNPKRRCFFSNDTDYNNIASATKVDIASDTILIYHQNPGSLKASIDPNVGEIFSQFGYYDRSWQKNGTWLKLESPASDGRTGGTHTYPDGAKQMQTDIQKIINGGKLTHYYKNTDGELIGVTTSGLLVPLSAVSKNIKRKESPEDAGVDEEAGTVTPPPGGVGDDDGSNSTKKYLLIGAAVVVVALIIVILKKK